MTTASIAAATPWEVCEGCFRLVFFGVAREQEVARQAPAEWAADDELGLVRRVQSRGPGAQVAFATLARRHERWLLALCGSLLGRWEDAQDVSQNVLVRAYLAMEQFAGHGSLRGWLRRITLNEAFNYRRGEAARQRRERASAAPEAPGESPAATEARDALYRVLDELPYVHREALILRYVEDMELQEIAELLDLGLSAVKMRLSRARQDFRDTYLLLPTIDHTQRA